MLPKPLDYAVTQHIMCPLCHLKHFSHRRKVACGYGVLSFAIDALGEDVANNNVGAAVAKVFTDINLENQTHVFKINKQDAHVIS